MRVVVRAGIPGELKAEIVFVTEARDAFRRILMISPNVDPSAVWECIPIPAGVDDREALRRV